MKPGRIATITVVAALATAVLLAIAPAALAHWPNEAPAAGAHAGLVAGLLHPFGGLDHLLATVALGMLAGRMGGHAVRVVPIAFLAALAVGFGAGTDGPFSALSEPAIAGSLVVLGGLVALGQRPPLAAASSIAALFAIFHGYAHGAELPAGAEAAAFGLGMILASALLTAASAAIALRAGRGLALRAGGAGIATAGLIFAAAL